MSPAYYKEVVGFLCRWCLLGGLAVAVLAATAASVLAAAGMSGDLRMGLVVPDEATAAASAGSRPCWVGGYVDPASGEQSGLAVLAAPGAGLRLGRGVDGRWYAPAPPPWAGRVEVVTRGMPYGPAAFQTCRSVIQAMPPRRTVFLVDARLMELAGPPALTVRHCARQMLALGEVVLFHPGPLEGFVRCRRRLRQDGIRLPVLCELKAGRPGRIFEVIARNLGRTPGEGIVAVNIEASLAEVAARCRVESHLVGGILSGPQPRAGVTVHDSPANLKDYLSRRPIPQ